MHDGQSVLDSLHEVMSYVLSGPRHFEDFYLPHLDMLEGEVRREFSLYDEEYPDPSADDEEEEDGDE